MFPSKEDALEFLEEYGLDEARIKLLVVLGRTPEAAETHARNGDILNAVEILSMPTTRGVDQMRPMIKYLLIGLRRGLTLEVLPSSSPATSRLLVLADQLDTRAMTEQEANEVSPSRQFNRGVIS